MIRSCRSRSTFPSSADFAADARRHDLRRGRRCLGQARDVVRRAGEADGVAHATSSSTRSLTLQPGKYTAIVGLAKAGQPVLVTTGPIEVAGPSKEAVGTSRLILSDNVYELGTAEPAKAPFAFGKLKIVPKGNLTFKNSDELNYFVEVNNPGIDPATNLPKLQYKLDLTGGPDKKTISAPLRTLPRCRSPARRARATTRSSARFRWPRSSRRSSRATTR